MSERVNELYTPSGVERTDDETTNPLERSSTQWQPSDLISWGKPTGGSLNCEVQVPWALNFVNYKRTYSLSNEQEELNSEDDYLGSQKDSDRLSNYDCSDDTEDLDGDANAYDESSDDDGQDWLKNLEDKWNDKYKDQQACELRAQKLTGLETNDTSWGYRLVGEEEGLKRETEQREKEAAEAAQKKDLERAEEDQERRREERQSKRREACEQSVRMTQKWQMYEAERLEQREKEAAEAAQKKDLGSKETLKQYERERAERKIENDLEQDKQAEYIRNFLEQKGLTGDDLNKRVLLNVKRLAERQKVKDEEWKRYWVRNLGYDPDVVLAEQQEQDGQEEGSADGGMEDSDHVY